MQEATAKDVLPILGKLTYATIPQALNPQGLPPDKSITTFSGCFLQRLLEKYKKSRSHRLHFQQQLNLRQAQRQTVSNVASLRCAKPDSATTVNNRARQLTCSESSRQSSEHADPSSRARTNSAVCPRQQPHQERSKVGHNRPSSASQLSEPASANRGQDYHVGHLSST